MSFNAKQFRHFSTSWQALREASVRSTTKIGRRFCRQGISKAPSSYDLHKSVFSCISAKSSMQSFFHARSCADSVFMHLFLHLFHATLVRASLFASLSVHMNTVSQQAHGTCQKTKQKTQQINLCIFHDPLVIFLLFAPACTTHCMVWDFIVTFHISGITSCSIRSMSAKMSKTQKQTCTASTMHWS